MGERFYLQQKKHKPGRRLKADIVKEVNELLGKEVKGLDKLTIAALDELYAAIEEKLIS